MTNRFKRAGRARRGVSLCAAVSVVATLAAVTPVASAGAQEDGPARDVAAPAAASLNTSDRAAVLNAYRNTYEPASNTPFSWTGGSVENCQPGTVSSATVAGTAAQLNFARQLVGSPATTVGLAGGKFQQAALMMDANDNAIHNPPASWRCYSTAGAEAAAESNLATAGSPAGVPGFLDDFGPSNAHVGHRWWLLDPNVQALGLGLTPGATVIGATGRGENTAAADFFAPWPSAGYFPDTMAPSQSRRWSISVYSGQWRFENATASVTVNGATQTVPVEFADFSRIVFNPTLPGRATDSSGARLDQAVTVRINGATFQGAPRPIQYTVTLVDPASQTGTDPTGPQTVTWSTAATVTGEPEVGESLGVDLGVYTPHSTSESVTVTWRRAGSSTVLATGPTYTVTAGDVGSAITATVNMTVRNSAGTLLGEGVIVAITNKAYSGGSPKATVSPRISGTGEAGSTLTVNTGTWDRTIAGYDFNWYRDSQLISGAHDSMYQPTSADIGFQIHALVTATDLKGRSAMAPSDQIAIIEPATELTNVTKPILDGNNTVGATLSVTSPGTWRPALSGASINYYWYRNGTLVTGSRTSTYTVQSSDAGATFTVRLIVTQGGLTGTSTSAPLTIEDDAGNPGTGTPDPSEPDPIKPGPAVSASGKPRFAGVLRVSRTVTGVVPTYSPQVGTQGIRIRFQWLRDGRAIRAATQRTYRLARADVNRVIAFRVIVTWPGHRTLIATSLARGPVRQA